MGKVHLIVGGSQVGTLSKPLPSGGVQVTKETSDGDGARMLAMMASKFAWDDTPTPQQIIDRWWAGIVQKVVDDVKRYEQEQAAKTAADAIKEINVT